MQRFINLDQIQLVKYSLNIVDGIILDYIVKANNWAKSKERDGRTFFLVHAGKVIADLPSLGLKTKAGILGRIRTLTASGLLERWDSTSPYYAPTEKLKDYYFAGHKEMNMGVYGNEYVTLKKWIDNSNINSNINYISIPVDQIKKKDRGLINELEILTSSLHGQTDLTEVSADDIISLRNNNSEEYRLPKILLQEVKTSVEKETNRQWARFKKVYTKEDFNRGLQNYLENIKNRKPDGKAGSYYNHRFTLPLFLKQENGIKKFMVL